MLSPKFIYTALAKSSLKTFLKILIFWTIVVLITLITLILIYLYSYSYIEPTYIKFLQTITGNIKIFSLIIIAGSFFLAMINYSVLRLCSRKPKTKVRIKEISLLSIVLLLSIGAGVYAKYSYTMQRTWMEALSDGGGDEELHKLLETGQYELAVQQMENSLACYRHTHKMLGSRVPNFYSRDRGGSGLSYMFTTCIGWSHTQRYISGSLDRFLQSADDRLNSYNKERDLHDYRQPKWQTLAQHMISSKEPILKCTGY